MKPSIDRPPVSVMIFTLNEEIHLPSCLKALEWCDDIIVVDSFSTDQTQMICQANNVRFFQNPFGGFGAQRNWALDNCQPKYEWILILDADERVTPELGMELAQIAQQNPKDVGAFLVKRRFHIWGRWLKYSSLYPTWLVRFIHRDRVRYLNRGHAETQEVQGQTKALTHDLIDENLKGIDEWFERQNRYSTKDAYYELEQERIPLNWQGFWSSHPYTRRATLKRLAYVLPARPLIYFIYSYLFRLGFLDGKDGLVFCRMKALYQKMVVIKKYDIRKGIHHE